MKHHNRRPIDFVPKLKLNVNQISLAYQLNLGLDIEDLLIISYIKLIKTVCNKLDGNDTLFSVVEDDGCLYYELNYREFASVYLVSKLTEDEFEDRLKELESKNILMSTFDGYYKCSGLVDEFLGEL